MAAHRIFTDSFVSAEAKENGIQDSTSTNTTLRIDRSPFYLECKSGTQDRVLPNAANFPAGVWGVIVNNTVTPDEFAVTDATVGASFDNSNTTATFSQRGDTGVFIVAHGTSGTKVWRLMLNIGLVLS